LVQQIDVRELAARMRAGEAVWLLDVRQPWEHEIARLPESVLIPLPELTARVGEVRPPAGALLVVYCHHGIRSLSAGAFLERAGFSQVVSLAGGIDAWSAEVDVGVPRY
jgi:adenylyltransferase/sulfurtransferase